MHATSPSLLERARRPADQAAWGRFVNLYTPLLHGRACRAHNNLGRLLRNLEKTEEALQEYQQARDLLRRVLNAQPDVPENLASPSHSCLCCCKVLLQTPQWRDALPDLDEGIRRTDELHSLAKRHLRITEFLLYGLRTRRGVLAGLGRVEEAEAADWQRALKPSPASQWLSVRMRRTNALAVAGFRVSAAAQAEELGRVSTSSTVFLYDLTRIHALNAAAVAKDVALPP